MQRIDRLMDAPDVGLPRPRYGAHGARSIAHPARALPARASAARRAAGHEACGGIEQDRAVQAAQMLPPTIIRVRRPPRPRSAVRVLACCARIASRKVIAPRVPAGSIAGSWRGFLQRAL